MITTRESHPDEEFAAINVRKNQGPRARHHTTYFCYLRRCQYTTKVREAIFTHYNSNETHCPPNMKQLQGLVGEAAEAAEEGQPQKKTRSVFLVHLQGCQILWFKSDLDQDFQLWLK